MDNFKIDVIAKQQPSLELALRLAFAHNAPGNKATHYQASAEKLLLYWNGDQQASALPFELTADNVTEFVWQWLQQASYSPEPDHDGDNVRGWRVRCDDWGHVDGSRYGIVAVETVWAMYGK